MGNSSSKLWSLIWRIPRSEYILLQFVIFFIWYISYCILGFISWGKWQAEPILIIPYFLSCIILAKRFQDCWVCWKWVLFLSVLTIICVTFESYILYILWFLLLCLYVIILIVMCFVKWDNCKNEYGEACK